MTSSAPRKHPLLYQINTRVVLYEFAQELGRVNCTLDDIPDSFLEQISNYGFQWVYMLGLWQMGPLGREITLSKTDLKKDYGRGLPDVTEEDVVGSPFAVQAYAVSSDFGGDAALARLRRRLKQKGLKLMADFVPNHVAVDHPWVRTNPEYFVLGDQAELEKESQNWIRLQTKDGEQVFAHGRDPNFDGWADTLQLDYRKAICREAMMTELALIARRCDGVRCDMAMLMLPEIFEKTWGKSTGQKKTVIDMIKKPSATMPDFWPNAIERSRNENKDFIFMAEVYWDLEYALQQQGFDFTYDKRLYDRLLAGETSPVLGHLFAKPDFMGKCVHFLENHDEARAAPEFGDKLKAVAIISFLIPGLSFFYEGQLEGRRSKVAIQLRRRPHEAVDYELNGFYLKLFDILKRPEVARGVWKLVQCKQSSKLDKQSTYKQFIAFSWVDVEKDATLLAVINYGPFHGICNIDMMDRRQRRGEVELIELMDQHFQKQQAATSISQETTSTDFAFGPWGFGVFKARLTGERT
jgi:hypothetical protein